METENKLKVNQEVWALGQKGTIAAIVPQDRRPNNILISYSTGFPASISYTWVRPDQIMVD